VPVTVIVNEVNTAPLLSGVPATVTTAPGSTIAFAATATDGDLVNGLPNTLTFSLVGAPANAWIDPDTGAFTWTPTESTRLGTYAFKVRVADDGVPSLHDTKSITVTVAAAAVVNGDLLVGGTGGNDAITVNPSKDLSQLIVTLNKAVVGSFPAASVTGKIVVHGLSGNDTITVSPKVTKPAWLFGEAGNDKLSGGGGNNLLVGGDGNDTLATKAGLNVMIGGAGADKLTGGSGDDLLIAGPTVYDGDLAGLTNIMTEWASANTYAQRVTNLTNGVNGTLLTAATVSDDGVKDTLTGKKGSDWFIVSTAAVTADVVKDLDPTLNEVKTIV
jgi:Ca2+-binding RTX toxin-like protein